MRGAADAALFVAIRSSARVFHCTTRAGQNRPYKRKKSQHARVMRFSVFLLTVPKIAFSKLQILEHRPWFCPQLLGYFRVVRQSGGSDSSPFPTEEILPRFFLKVTLWNYRNSKLVPNAIASFFVKRWKLCGIERQAYRRRQSSIKDGTNSGTRFLQEIQEAQNKECKPRKTLGKLSHDLCFHNTRISGTKNMKYSSRMKYVR